MPDKKIIYVDASFEQGECLFKTLQKYAQHSDNLFAYWEEFAFTTNPNQLIDGCLVFNTPSKKIKASCFPEWTVAFMMEPGIKKEHPWMFKSLDQYARVYSPVNSSSNTIESHGFLGWHYQHNWQFFKHLTENEKKLPISCIASNLTLLKGHRRRVAFIERLRQEMPDIHYFGKGIKFLQDKLHGLHPYRFSIAIENTSEKDYFTEKINDCFLAYTVPLYYGCKNIGKYFPADSYIWIDINKPAEAIETIKKAISEDNWSYRLEAIKEARELVLNKYQPLAGAASIFRSIPVQSARTEIKLKPAENNIKKRVSYFLAKIRSLSN